MVSKDIRQITIVVCRLSTSKSRYSTDLIPTSFNPRTTRLSVQSPDHHYTCHPEYQPPEPNQWRGWVLDCIPNPPWLVAIQSYAHQVDKCTGNTSGFHWGLSMPLLTTSLCITLTIYSSTQPMRKCTNTTSKNCFKAYRNLGSIAGLIYDNLEFEEWAFYDMSLIQMQ